MKKMFIAAAALALGFSPVFAKSPAPTAEQIKAVLEANPDIVLDVLRQNEDAFFSIVKDAARADQMKEQQEEEAAQQEKITDAIKSPLKPEIDPSSHSIGNKNAKYTLVEYADFQCPYCGRALPTVETLRAKYGADMRFIFKTMPLVSIHPQAMPSAEYFEAISLQSQEKAWKFYDVLFKNQDKLGDDFYKDTARKLGVNMSRLAKDLKNPEVSKRIAANTAEFDKFGFSGTPGFLINGVPVFGAYPIDYFEDIIKQIDAAHKG